MKEIAFFLTIFFTFSPIFKSVAGKGSNIAEFEHNEAVSNLISEIGDFVNVSKHALEQKIGFSFSLVECADFKLFKCMRPSMYKMKKPEKGLENWDKLWFKNKRVVRHIHTVEYPQTINPQLKIEEIKNKLGNQGFKAIKKGKNLHTNFTNFRAVYNINHHGLDTVVDFMAGNDFRNNGYLCTIIFLPDSFPAAD